MEKLWLFGGSLRLWVLLVTEEGGGEEASLGCGQL